MRQKTYSSRIHTPITNFKSMIFQKVTYFEVGDGGAGDKRLADLQERFSQLQSEHDSLQKSYKLMDAEFSSRVQAIEDAKQSQVGNLQEV